LIIGVQMADPTGTGNGRETEETGPSLASRIASQWGHPCFPCCQILEEATITMSDCLFCGVLSDLASASIVRRDDICTAILDIQPVKELIGP